MNTEFNELQIKSDLQKSGSVIVMDRESLAIQADLSDPSQGYVFAPTKRPVYNTDELKKAIDVEVKELIPDGPETDLDLVPGPIYRDTVESLEDALALIEEQSQEIADLETKVSELESTVETLRADLDNSILQQVLAETNADNLRQQLVLITENAQSALQRSIQEGIEKSSLSGRNEGLFAQNESLKSEIVTLNEQIDRLEDQLFGKQAAIEAGAKAGSDIAVRVINKPSPEFSDLTYRAKADSNGKGKWINGGEVEIFNFTDEAVIITLSQVNVEFLSTSTPKTINLDAKKKIVQKFEVDYGRVDDYLPSAGVNFRSDRSHKGTLNFTTSNGTVSLSLEVQKQVGGKWG